MGRNAIQFQKGLSMPEFQKLYGTEAQCEEALAQIRWPNGFSCPRCEGVPYGLVYGRRLKRYQCRQCGHQATVTSGTIISGCSGIQTLSFRTAFHPGADESCPGATGLSADSEN